MKKYRSKRTGPRMVSVLTLILVVAGLGLIGYSLLREDSPLPWVVSTAMDDEPTVSASDTTLKLTVPKMARVNDLPVHDAPWDDVTVLDTSASHLQGTGFPWQEGANVYIAGHRMGWPGTKSFLVFYDLDVLENGDEIFLTGSDGTTYTYRVFNKFVANPFDSHFADPVPGKSIVTLQTCTLPDYSQRFIVQGELTRVG
jgi:sortase A